MKYLNLSIAYKIKYLCILLKVFRSMYFYPQLLSSILADKYTREHYLNKDITLRMCKEELKSTGGFKALLQLTNFTLGPDATLNTEIHKHSVRIKAPNSVNASKRKHKNQINHYNKDEYSWLILLYARVNENQ